MYAIGGNSDGIIPLSTVVSYDPASRTWGSEASMSIPRFYPSASKGQDGKLYVFGGWDVNGNALNDVEIYDPTSNTWSEGAPMPTARGEFSTVTVGSQIYAIEWI